ncbi:ComF family protein [Yersinia enterocolitica]|uniref:ComF family protein n=1 Tax=Yersinia TaxID=629 RepID=UPI0020BDBE04|nr:ComF family protein [Yersinia ruckeri]EKN6275846.1 ComF family protein [Yersinia enterocolitica]EKN6284708.1 ComF family protein [Yersinia enterocolitica]ELY5205388.1 ComF family protein [Yersinia enterocolitica]MCK8566283.1 ComF family protein [Yersinia ruckeri]
MQVNIKPIVGNWDLGYAIDKHSVRSIMTGHNEYGHPVFDTLRTEVGESLYQLKYKFDWNQVDPLAECLLEHAVPLFTNIQLIIPMAASNPRTRQPVTAITDVLAQMMGGGMMSFNDLLLKAPGGKSLKNLSTKEDKVAAIANSFSFNDQINQNGPYNALIVDDLYHTGASMEAACAVLRSYNKINKIYVAALTWR